MAKEVSSSNFPDLAEKNTVKKIVNHNKRVFWFVYVLINAFLNIRSTASCSHYKWKYTTHQKFKSRSFRTANVCPSQTRENHLIRKRRLLQKQRLNAISGKEPVNFKTESLQRYIKRAFSIWMLTGDLTLNLSLRPRVSPSPLKGKFPGQIFHQLK